MKLSSAATPARLALSGLAILLPVSLPVSLAVTVAVTVAATLSGCSSLDGVFGGDKVDYRTTAAKTQPLEVPPDLTQLARESRYQPQGGVISASAVGLPATAGAPSTVPGTPGVVPASTGGVRVERQGQQRWLVVPQTPEQVWPQLKAFWEQRGFTLAEENLAAGVMETNWAENRAKLPADAIRSALGKVFGNLYDTGERAETLEQSFVEPRLPGQARGIVELYAQGRGADPR